MPDGTHWASTDTKFLTGVVQGTRVQTVSGECRVEHLCAGDRIVTANKATAVLTSVTRQACRASGAAAPVRVLHGCVGNHRDIAVAPGQVLSVDGALMAASTLSKHAMAETAFGGVVTYFQLHFEHDVLVTAEGAVLAFGREGRSISMPTAKPTMQAVNIRLI